MSVAVEFHEVAKSFGPVRVLHNVSFALGPGRIYALIGENGAGKSTLMKILAGYEPLSGGELRINGRAVHFSGSRAAEAEGIVLIHQEFNLAEDLTIAQNIFLGHEKKRGWLLDDDAMRAEAARVLEQVGLKANPDTKLRQLIVAEKLLPETLSYEQAAPIFCAGYTVWSGLRWARPQPGERLAVIGIGGLGHLAIQYAKAAGFITIAISRSTDKDKMIRELGADEIVRDGKGLAAAGGADVILGTSNSVDAMADSIAGLRPDGRLVLMGFENKPLPVQPFDLIARRIRVLGSQQNSREYLYEALQIAATGKVKVITETYPLAEIATAYERVEQGKARFRAVITMGD